MSRKTIIIGSIAALAALSLLSVAAVARPGGGPSTRRGGGMGMSSCRMDGGMRPSFTSEQREQMDEIRDGFEDERVELQNKIKVLHLEMKDLVASDNPDFGKLEGMIDDLSKLKADMMKLRLRQHRAMRDILDEDQRVLFDRGIGRMLGHGGRGGMASPGRSGMGAGPGRGMRGCRVSDGSGPGGMRMGMGPGGRRVEKRVIVEIEDEEAQESY